MIFNALLGMARAVLLIFDFFKVSRVLTMYSVTLLSRIMIVKKLCIVKLTIIPVSSSISNSGMSSSHGVFCSLFFSIVIFVDLDI